MIRFESVSKRFGTGPPAVEELSLEVGQGELTTLVGPSGCGKTTSLRMINRLEDLSEGRIIVNGQDIMACDRTQLRRGIGYVMQSSGLFPHRRIHENISTVPRLLGWDKKRIETRIQGLVEVVGLAPDLLERYPHALSGGQQQRVGVARALAADPPVLLMDEPFAAVDPIVRTHLQDEFIRLQRQLHKTIVFVTHDIDEAIKIGDRIAVMREPGHLEQYATPSDLLAAPANDFVVDFLGRERELRRLALIRVSEIEPEPAPTVALSGSAGDARASAERQGRGWVIVLTDDDRLQGWLPLDRLDGETVDTEAVTPFEYPVMAKDSLRAALNAIVASGIGLAARLDDEGRFEGTISQASLSRKLAA